jgi:alpha-2-macroglobulin
MLNLILKPIALIKKYWLQIVTIVVALCAITFGYQYYYNFFHHGLVTVKISTPEIIPLPKPTASGESNIPLPIASLTVRFSKAVAPLKLVDKEIPAGTFNLSPAVAGTWRWEANKALVFTPQEEWPAGKEFKINYAESAFNPGAQVPRRLPTFTTQPLTINISEFKFYHDLANPKNKEVVATIGFNYPVNPASLENKITLARQAQSAAQKASSEATKAAASFDTKLRFTVTYDQYKRTAYLHSQPLNIESKEYYIKLDIDKGVAPLKGANAAQRVYQTVLVPDNDTLFKISNADAVIVRDAQDRPEQVLNIETTDAVATTALNQVLHVYLLPKDRPATADQAVEVGYTWSRPNEIDSAAKQLMTPVELEPIPAGHENTTLHSYRIKLNLKNFGKPSKPNQSSSVVKNSTESTVEENAAASNDNSDEESAYTEAEDYNPDSEGGYAENKNGSEIQGQSVGKQKYYLLVTIDDKLKSSSNFKLQLPYENVVAVPPYPNEISFLHKGSILALNSEKKLSLLTRGVPAVKATIAKIMPDAINHLVSQTRGDFNNPTFINQYDFNQNNISEIFTETQQVNNSDAAKTQYLALDLNKYLTAGKTPFSAAVAGPGPRGLFLLKLQGWDIENKKPLRVHNQRLILITDLGLIVKDNADDTHDVFVASITSGMPVAGAEIAILGRNGVPLLKRTTDQLGRVTFPDLKDFQEEQQPTVYLAKLGNDVSFIPCQSHDRQLNYTRYDVGGETNYAQNKYNLKAFIFTERGIYRPGETMHIGAIVKRNYLGAAPAKLPIEAVITDPQGKEVNRQKVLLDEFGYFTLDYKTDETSVTGRYTIALYLAEKAESRMLLSEISASVQEFLPDRMKLNAKFGATKDGKAIAVGSNWIAPSEAQVKIELQNLYGNPAAERRVAGKLFLEPQTIRFDQYRDYVFTNPFASIQKDKLAKTYSEDFKELQTDNNGQATLQLNQILSRFDQAIYNLTLFVEAFEKDGGRSVATKITTLINPLPYLVGYNPFGDLHFIKQNSQHKVHLIALNNNLKTQALAQLTMETFAKQQTATLTKKPDGTYQYQTIEQLSLINSAPFSIAADGANYQLATDKIGAFRIVIKDQQKNEICSFDYNIVGASQKSIQQNAELSVKLNKNSFLPNEEVELEITAPYTGSGLITLERDKVYAAQWFQTATTNSLQKIRIPQDFKGDAYINVTFIRDWNSSEIFITPLSYNVTPIKVIPEAQIINLTLQAPSIAFAGRDLPITYSSNKPGKIIIFAVDEGILQLTRYAVPAPIKFFFAKHALEVATMQILDQILPKYIMQRELSAAGGDAGSMALDKKLNPFKRKTDAPVVYWSKILDVNAQPQRVVYQVPNYFNGTLRIMAVAVAAEAVGAAVTTTKVGNYFVINPNAPTFVAPGDEFEVTATIGNNLKQMVGDNSASAAIKVKLATSSGLEIIDGKAEQAITVAQNGEKSVRFKLRAKEVLGNATLTFTAASVSADRVSTTNTTLSIRPATPHMTTINSGFTKEHESILSIDRALYPQHRSVAAVLSSSPLVLLSGMQAYLENFPYFCTEQITSKLFVILATLQNPGINVTERQKLTEKLQNLLQLLRSRQLGNGGFSYWSGGSDLAAGPSSNANSKFASLYALHFITEAKAAGVSIPNEMLSRGISYLKEFLQAGADAEANRLDEQRLRAYAIYLLTRNEIVTTNYLTNLQLLLEDTKNDPDQRWKQDITSAYLAATYKLLQNEKMAKKIIDYFAVNLSSRQAASPNDASGGNDGNGGNSGNGGFEQYGQYSNFYNHNIVQAQYLHLIAQHFPEQLTKYSTSLVLNIATNLNSRTINTTLAGYSSLALMSINSKNVPGNAAALTITELLPNRVEKVVSLIKDGVGNKATQTQFVQQNALISEAAQKVMFSSEPSYKGGFFYQLTQAGFDKDLAAQKRVESGIEIWREYRDLNDKVITEAKLGQEVKVNIKIRNKDRESINNLAIVDLLPGGFDVVRGSICGNNTTNVPAPTASTASPVSASLPVATHDTCYGNFDYADTREDRVIFFAYLPKEGTKEIVYRIKAVNNGSYTIPPAFVEAMYDNSKKALGKSGRFMVAQPE